jgi:hypothetical protein
MKLDRPRFASWGPDASFSNVEKLIPGISQKMLTKQLRQLEPGDLVLLDGPAFHQIERSTHFLCYRKAVRDNARLLVLRALRFVGVRMMTDRN